MTEEQLKEQIRADFKWAWSAANTTSPEANAACAAAMITSLAIQRQTAAMIKIHCETLYHDRGITSDLEVE